MDGTVTLSVLSWLPVMTLPSIIPSTLIGWWWARSLWLILHSGLSGRVCAWDPFTLIADKSSLWAALGMVLDWGLLFRVTLGEERFIGELSWRGKFKLGLTGTPTFRNSSVPSKRATTIWGLKEKKTRWCQRKTRPTSRGLISEGSFYVRKRFFFFLSEQIKSAKAK